MKSHDRRDAGRRYIRRARVSAILALLVFGVAACRRHDPVSRVTSIEARIDGITCPTCVPPLTASLKREYSNSAIDVDDDKDTATIRFAENENFSAPEFHAAVERVLRMRVVTLHLHACGKVEASNGDTWLTAGANRFLVRSDRELPLNEPICADGTLDSGRTPALLRVSAFAAQRASGS